MRLVRGVLVSLSMLVVIGAPVVGADAYATPLVGHTESVSSVAFALDGRTVASAGQDGTVLLWDVRDPAQPTRLGEPLVAHTRALSVAFVRDGETLAAAGDGSVILWDVSDPAHAEQLGEPLTGHTGQVNSVAFASKGQTLASGGADGTVILWDMSDPAEAKRLDEPLTGGASQVRSVAFSEDGRTLATAGDQTVILWDVADPAHAERLGEPLTAHTGQVNTVAFASKGSILASGDTDGTVILWEASTPTLPTRLGQLLVGRGVNSVAFAGDGSVLATASEDNTVILWDVSDPALPKRLGEPLTGHAGQVNSVAFAPDGRTMVSGSSDGSVILRPITATGPVPAPTTTTGNSPAPVDDGFVYMPWGPNDPPIPSQYAALAASAGSPPRCGDTASAQPDSEFWDVAVAVCRAITEGQPWPATTTVPAPPPAANEYQACLDKELATVLQQALRWHAKYPDRRPDVSYPSDSTTSPCQARIYDVRVLGESDPGSVALAVTGSAMDQDPTITVDDQVAEPVGGFDVEDPGDGLTTVVVQVPAEPEPRAAKISVETYRGTLTSEVRVPGVAPSTDEQPPTPEPTTNTTPSDQTPPPAPAPQPAPTATQTGS